MADTKCTPDLVKHLCQEIEQGCSIQAACGAEGIHRSTLQAWKARGKKGEEPFKTFSIALKRSIEIAVGRAEKRIALAGEKRWEANARWLESMRPKRWRRTERREVTQTSDIRVAWPDLAPETPDALAKRCASIDEALRKPGRN